MYAHFLSVTHCFQLQHTFPFDNVPILFFPCLVFLPSVEKCMSSMQMGTQMVKLRGGSKGLVRFFYLDEHKSCIRWRPSRKNEKAKSECLPSYSHKRTEFPICHAPVVHCIHGLWKANCAVFYVTDEGSLNVSRHH